MFLFFSNSSSIHAYRPENHDAPDLWDALDHRAPIGASLVGGVARYGKQATTVAENIESVAIFCMCFRMFIVFSHVAEDYRCLIDFNFLSVDDHPCFHGFSQNARIEKKKGQWTVSNMFCVNNTSPMDPTRWVFCSGTPCLWHVTDSTTLAYLGHT